MVIVGIFKTLIMPGDINGDINGDMNGDMTDDMNGDMIGKCEEKVILIFILVN